MFFFKGEYRDATVPISPNEAHFRWGTGFFETILHSGQNTLHLNEHLARIHNSLKHFGFTPAKANIPDIISKLLEENGLEVSPARINVFYPIEDMESDNSLYPLVQVSPYLPQSERTWSLTIHKEPQASFLGAHKSMSYFPYALSKRQAVQQGRDDAIMLDQQGHVLEASTGNLLFSKGKTFYTPKSPYALPGVTLDVSRQFISIVDRQLTPDELHEFDHVFILNALIGLQPVTAIENTAFTPDWETCKCLAPMLTGALVKT